MTEHDLFVYGTLRFGDVRWRFLEPFVVDRGVPDTAQGQLFDTGAGYPAAIFDGPRDSTWKKQCSDRVIIGHRYRLIRSETAAALKVLDEVESAVTGMYQRIRITTNSGAPAWAYQYGLDLDNRALTLRKIISGDWFEVSRHRPDT